MATPHDDAPPAPIADDLITMAVERAVQVWEGQNGASIKVNPGPVRVLIEDAYARGRREAIEEAAQAAEECSGGDYETRPRHVIATKIRRLGAVSR